MLPVDLMRLLLTPQSVSDEHAKTANHTARSMCVRKLRGKILRATSIVTPAEANADGVPNITVVWLFMNVGSSRL
jgi:hypothetical protein